MKHLGKLAYGKVNGKWLPKSQYFTEVHKKEAREIIRLDSRAAKVQKVIEAMKDDNYSHPHAIPYHLRETEPTRTESELGIPQCCNHQEMVISWFDNDMRYCRTCRKSRVRV